MSEKINANITGRIIIRGQLVLETPLLIGGGEGETDIAVVRDSQGNPYIPATALAGALRHYYFKHPLADVEWVVADYFWGSPKNEGREVAKGTFQSAFYLDDLWTNEKIEPVYRDGVAINEKGIAKGQQKYDYEVIEPGAAFYLRSDIILRNGFDRTAFLKILGLLRGALENGAVMLGAMNAKGFGRVRLEGFTATEYDYTRREHVLNWLAGKAGDDPKIEAIKPVIADPEDFCLEAIFRMDHSLIVRSYSTNPYEPDASQIKSGGIPILPGASLKGAIRARAGRILKTLGIGERDSIQMKSLFGWVDTDNKSGEKIKSRVIIRESIITNAVAKDEAKSPEKPKNPPPPIARKIFKAVVRERLLRKVYSDALIDADSFAKDPKRLPTNSLLGKLRLIFTRQEKEEIVREREGILDQLKKPALDQLRKCRNDSQTLLEKLKEYTVSSSKGLSDGFIAIQAEAGFTSEETKNLSRELYRTFWLTFLAELRRRNRSKGGV